MVISICKSFDFCYGHFLPGHSGKCANMHGHNSRVEVEVRTPTGQLVYSPFVYPGMVMDFGDLKKIVGEIIDRLDHKTLNILPVFKDATPTAEHIAMYLFSQINTLLPDGIVLSRIRVSETLDSWAEIKEGRIC
jgi:6-pyruvoyltetrahydropterin/6-carboxytetrahydropterin synthase